MSGYGEGLGSGNNLDSVGNGKGINFEIYESWGDIGFGAGSGAGNELRDTNGSGWGTYYGSGKTFTEHELHCTCDEWHHLNVKWNNG